MRLDVTGDTQILAALRRLEGAVSGSILESAAVVGAEVIRGQAAHNAPVDTGNLRASLTTDVETSTSERAVVAIGPGSQAPYGRFVELGTRRMRAQPYLRPAFDSEKTRAESEVGAAIRRQIERVT